VNGWTVVAARNAGSGHSADRRWAVAEALIAAPRNPTCWYATTAWAAGSAEVKVDGSTYTISGEAQGADMKNPMAGMITKKFEIKVTCS
jgi:Mycobacterium 19 kDa lipoprotein antigen